MVVAIDVLRDVFNYVRDGQRIGARLFNLKVRNVLEIAEKRPVKTIEHDEL